MLFIPFPHPLQVCTLSVSELHLNIALFSVSRKKKKILRDYSEYGFSSATDMNVSGVPGPASSFRPLFFRRPMSVASARQKKEKLHICGQRRREPGMSHLSHKWTQRQVVLWTILETKRKALWHKHWTIWSVTKDVVYKSDPTDTTHTAKLGEYFLSILFASGTLEPDCHASCRTGASCKDRTNSENKLYIFLSVTEQHGICKYYVCRLVWVISWVFSLSTTGASSRRLYENFYGLFDPVSFSWPQLSVGFWAHLLVYVKKIKKRNKKENKNKKTTAWMR